MVDCAVKAGQSETDYYMKTIQTCRQYENNPDICNLCLNLLGSEYKKISATIADWVETKRYETKVSGKK